MSRYLTSLELVVSFIDLCKTKGFPPSLLETARRVFDRRLKLAGARRKDRIDAYELISKIVGTIRENRSLLNSVAVREVVKDDADRGCLSLLLRAGLISERDNLISLTENLFLYYLVYQEASRNHDNYFIQQQSLTDQLYWRIVSNVENGELEKARGFLVGFVKDLTGFQSGQWNQLAAVLASLPQSCWVLEEVRILTRIYLSIQELFPSPGNWIVKDIFLRDLLDSSVATESNQRGNLYVSSLSEFGSLLGTQPNPFENKLGIILAKLSDPKSPLLLKINALSALRNYSPDEKVFEMVSLSR